VNFECTVAQVATFDTKATSPVPKTASYHLCYLVRASKTYYGNEHCEEKMTSAILQTSWGNK